MTDAKVRTVTGKAIAIVGDDIDTDRIIPARFLKEITFANLGKFPFFDERYDDAMNEKEHPFNHGDRQGARLLFVNKNFGCGSSREHAPQALHRWGIHAIVGESFAEIFASNCITLGIPAVTASGSDMREVQDRCQAQSELQWTVDLATGRLTCADASIDVHMREHHKNTLMEGLWDSTSLLLDNMDKVASLYDSLPYTNGYNR
ncbi:MAG: 3-isopropylmalate dehydratase small subunit [Acidiferrobacterales bacterium]|nr:3-isopropylmalate dehydratase small subunit [Acidiferrobacterales bacterium]